MQSASACTITTSPMLSSRVVEGLQLAAEVVVSGVLAAAAASTAPEPFPLMLGNDTGVPQTSRVRRPRWVIADGVLLFLHKRRRAWLWLMSGHVM